MWFRSIVIVAVASSCRAWTGSPWATTHLPPLKATLSAVEEPPFMKRFNNVLNPIAKQDFLRRGWGTELGPDTSLTHWLCAMNQSTPQDIGAGVRVLPLNSNVENPFDMELTNQVVIREFYPRLFDRLRRNDAWRCALIGNPGIGKSWFQVYYILRCMCPEQYGGAVENSPECIIRHVAPEILQFYFLRDLEVWSGKSSDAKYLLDCLDRNKCVYLFEPLNTDNVQPSFLNMRSVATVSPLIERIKEYLKRGVPFYMPGWELDELQALGKHLRNTLPDNDDVQHLFTPEHIKYRFNRFGGIARYALPRSATFLASLVDNQAAAIRDADFTILTRNGTRLDSSDRNIKHYLLQYRVDKNTFGRPTLQYPGPIAENMLMQAARTLDLYGNLRILMEIQQGLDMRRGGPVLEAAVSQMLERGIPFDVVENPTNASLPPSSLRVEYITNLTTLVARGELEEGILYVPMDHTFPFVEYFYKMDGEFYGIQCKSGSHGKEMNSCAARKLREQLGLAATRKLHVWFVTFRTHIDAWKDRKWAPANGTEEQQATEHITRGLLTHSFLPTPEMARARFGA